MRHQLRSMLHQLAENGRLGMPAAPSDEDDARLAARRQQAEPAKGASNLRKAQAAASQPQQG